MVYRVYVCDKATPKQSENGRVACGLSTSSNEPDQDIVRILVISELVVQLNTQSQRDCDINFIGEKM